MSKYIFFKKGGFCPLELESDEDAAMLAEKNQDTKMVRDSEGKTIWMCQRFKEREILAKKLHSIFQRSTKKKQSYNSLSESYKDAVWQQARWIQKTFIDK